MNGQFSVPPLVSSTGIGLNDLIRSGDTVLKSPCPSGCCPAPPSYVIRAAINTKGKKQDRKCLIM